MSSRPTPVKKTWLVVAAGCAVLTGSVAESQAAPPSTLVEIGRIYRFETGLVTEVQLECSSSGCFLGWLLGCPKKEISVPGEVLDPGLLVPLVLETGQNSKVHIYAPVEAQLVAPASGRVSLRAEQSSGWTNLYGPRAEKARRRVIDYAEGEAGGKCSVREGPKLIGGGSLLSLVD